MLVDLYYLKHVVQVSAWYTEQSVRGHPPIVVMGLFSIWEISCGVLIPSRGRDGAISATRRGWLPYDARMPRLPDLSPGAHVGCSCGAGNAGAGQ